MKKVALIEFNSYHDECLYSQIKFLKHAEYEVTLVVSQEIFERATEYLSEVDHTIFYSKISQKNLLNRIVFLARLYRKLRKKGIRTAIFNTASSRLEVILLSHLLKRKVALFGILHNLKKVNNSFSQKLINKAIKHFFVLNDFLMDSVTLQDNSIKIKSFYPIFFPEYENPLPVKPKDEVWISIPGKLDFGRRDYYLVAEALESMPIKDNLKILILGSTYLKEQKNNEFLEYLKERNLLNCFITFEDFLENDAFHGYLKNSDYILIPLRSVGDNYAKFKIMGSYNLAFGYGINLISPQGLEHIQDMASHSLFYENANELSEIFTKISNGEIGKKDYVSDKWTFKEQKNRYINFLENKE
ncbi:hypothetical protein [Allomuricauda sp. M10]|uniref:hypothetical protein n=1 Tax=Allomuricauda sp. M10 TaxID=2683292 RepID=UPI001D198484|nr:hypothetical protein [Muricauda sp. M10]